MVVWLMTRLSRLLYPNEFVMEPGRFESFISGVAALPEGACTRSS